MFHDVKLTRGELLELKVVLETTNFDFPQNNRFRYMVTKNMEVFQKEIDEINEAFPAPNGLVDYTQKRREIYKKYDIKDAAAYEELPEETKKSVDTEITQLETDNKALIDEINELEKEKTDFLNDEIKVKLYKLKMDLMPSISQHNEYPAWDIWAILLKHVIIEPDD